ncbi:MAG: aspartate--tRNA ligase [Bacteroidetes bacterium]|jgi:aspartyl-tRNA synthetase|nr:aspartate--tRNA ligase [Bacteroidota bacterium]
MNATTLRTHSCGQLRMADAGQPVALCGWVQTTRDFGQFIFIDLRDLQGITQIAIAQEHQPELYRLAKTLGREYVLRVEGSVHERENKNPKNPTGDIEIRPTQLSLLNRAELPPFLIQDDTDGSEELRLQYRYLDIRRPALAHNLRLRARVAAAMRRFLDARGFLEIETPNFIRATPEGARDFLVPSRMHPGTFYALPQSPQILKQLLMVAGMDRYYQITKCYRDEDFRGDRQPEFTQLDCEMSFVGQEDILSTFEALVQQVFQDTIGVDIPALPRISYAECMEKYGSDKPDLRFGMELITLNAQVAGTDFGVFNSVLQGGGLIAGICAPGLGHYSRKQTDALIDYVKQSHLGLKGLVSLRVEADGSCKSSADKFFGPEQLAAIARHMQAQPGDLVLIGADSAPVVRRSLGALRKHIADTEQLYDPDSWNIFYVIDFPLFERDEQSGQLVAIHHPFVMPHEADWAEYKAGTRRPEDIRALCYDMVMNGNEVMSGSVRIHREDIQDEVFGLLGLSEAEIRQQFGFLLRAFRYGAPPHAGCAFGLDRILMLMTRSSSIRDVMAFPKNSAGRDLMLEAPAPVDARQLKDLHIRLEQAEAPTA